MDIPVYRTLPFSLQLRYGRVNSVEVQEIGKEKAGCQEAYKSKMATEISWDFIRVTDGI